MGTIAQRTAAPDERLERAQVEQFVKANGTRLLHTAYGLCGDWQHAEDLVQHVLVTVATRWSGITGDPLSYAFRCLARANIDRWRRVRRRLEVVADPAALGALPVTADAPSVSSLVADHVRVLDALRTLPARQRSILVLRYLQDLTETDTAAALGISVGAVKSGASRGLARLRTSLPDPEVDQ